MDELLKHVWSGRRNIAERLTDYTLSCASRILILVQLPWCRRRRWSLHREGEICPRLREEDNDGARRWPRIAATVWAVAMTLPKNLIADLPCKLSNGKGFRGTCPLARSCTRSYEIEISSLLWNCVIYLYGWSWEEEGKGLSVSRWGDGHHINRVTR